MADSKCIPPATAPIQCAAFTESRVEFVRPHDTRCASFWRPDAAGLEQDHDGPTLIVIGVMASDKQLQKLSARLARPLHELTAFRDLGRGA